MSPENHSDEGRTDWGLLITLSIMGILFLSAAIGGALRWNWSDAYVSLMTELGAALATLVGFFWLTRRIILQPARGKHRQDYDGPPAPQVGRRWAAYATIGGISLVGLAFIAASARAHPIWVSLAIEFGISLMLLAFLAMVEVLVVSFSRGEADYKPKRAGDLCYQADPPSPVTREWLIDGALLTCGHDPAHTYTEPLIDFPDLPDLSISGLFFPGVKERWHRFRRISGGKSQG